MTILDTLLKRSSEKCELCGSANNLSSYNVEPNDGASSDSSILCCDVCQSQIQDPGSMDTNHWRCLNDSMWSQEPVVQVMAWRQLKLLSSELWAQDLLEMLYLDDSLQKWAEAGLMIADAEAIEPTRDSNGSQLQVGDNVTIIKDLVVKGAGFTAKRGTTVRGISLTSNPEHIEGRVNGTRVVLVSAYMKKL
ncbi:MAG: PhnA domain-containing protein [Pseudomonadales bacterium]|nr:PhnA domain-containing protein [Pseudomonadales bacterium]NRA17292.1 PhnA domain-containing protein [Oceanospirillaceae bacterium]